MLHDVHPHTHTHTCMHTHTHTYTPTHTYTHIHSFAPFAMHKVPGLVISDKCTHTHTHTHIHTQTHILFSESVPLCFPSIFILIWWYNGLTAATHSLRMADELSTLWSLRILKTERERERERWTKLIVCFEPTDKIKSLNKQPSAPLPPFPPSPNPSSDFFLIKKI